MGTLAFCANPSYLPYGDGDIDADVAVEICGLPLRNIFEDFLRTCHTIIARIQNPPRKNLLQSIEFQGLERHARQTIVQSYFS